MAEGGPREKAKDLYKESILEQYVTITASDKESARHLLDTFSWNLHLAVNMYFEGEITLNMHHFVNDGDGSVFSTNVSKPESIDKSVSCIKAIHNRNYDSSGDARNNKRSYDNSYDFNNSGDGCSSTLTTNNIISINSEIYPKIKQQKLEKDTNTMNVNNALSGCSLCHRPITKSPR